MADLSAYPRPEAAASNTRKPVVAKRYRSVVSRKGIEAVTKWQAHEIPLRNHRILEALHDGVGLVAVAEQFDLSEGHIAHIAREAQFKPKHHLSPDDSLSERDRFILALALSGATFSSIARDFGVSREWVRRIVKKRGGISARDGLLDIRANVRRRKAEEDARRIANANPNLTIADIAEQSGLSVADIEGLLGQAECIRRLEGRDQRATVSDDEIFEELRRCSRLPGGFPLAAGFYDKQRCAESVSTVRLHQRFGSWRQACAAAGVEAHDPVRTYSSRWSDEDDLHMSNLNLRHVLPNAICPPAISDPTPCFELTRLGSRRTGIPR